MPREVHIVLFEMLGGSIEGFQSGGVEKEVGLGIVAGMLAQFITCFGSRFSETAGAL
jgi:hypothetical protein